MSINRINLSSWVLIAVAVLSFCLLLEAGVVGSNAHPVEEDNENTNILTTHDMDEDGLSDSLEEDLGTEKDNKYGDFDNDGLYDFEEYLDLYGNNDTTDGRKYKYNDSTTYDGDNGPILDIYHYFNLSTNKTMYYRDTKYSTTKSGGFTDHLFWGVDFDTDQAGGGGSTVLNLNNIYESVNFSGDQSGGGYDADVTYENSTLRNVIFSKETAGGSILSATTYKNNILKNVLFSGGAAGGSADGRVEYVNNIFENVTFSGEGSGASGFKQAGGPYNRPVVYTNNSFKQVVFSGRNAGLRYRSASSTTYTDNTFNDVKYSNIVDFLSLHLVFTDNTILSDSYDSDTDGTSDAQELFVHKTNPSVSDTDGDTLGDSWEIRYKESSGVNPRSAASQSELDSNADTDGLTLSEEAAADTNPDNNDTDGDGLNDSYEVELKINATLVDTDRDGLHDKWEVTYNGSFGVNPLVPVMMDELSSDRDNDTLTLLEEYQIGTNPGNNDTDDDKLSDGWEAEYKDASDIDPLDPTNLALTSDTDSDSLTLLEEARAGTNHSSNDTDSDGFDDKWEVTYNGSFGVNPLVPAMMNELSSDRDNDTLTLLEEYQIGTDPDDNDTDDDKLSDGWEAEYKDASDIDPLDPTNLALTSDTDSDSLTLLEEARAGTNHSSNDTDSDGLDDGWEVIYKSLGLDPTIPATLEELNSDADGDGLTLLEEYQAGTNPEIADSDGDGLGDGWELKYNGSQGINPLVNATLEDLESDTDNDSLTLLEEARAGTNHSSNDTDSDGFDDKWEVMYMDVQGIDPVIPANSTELALDTDGDGLTLLEEFQIGTNPGNADSDDDGLGDGWELRYNDSLGVNPVIPANSTELELDTDGDGLTLLQEAQGNTDPSKDDSVLDDDKDGLTNKLEAQIGSDPFSNDTDDDGIPDEYEYLNGLSLNKDDAAGDLDEDGLNNLLEFQLGSTGNNSDTDSDGIPDGYEYTNGLSLNKDDAAGDLDEDGLNNSYEFSLGLLANNSDSDNDTLPDGYEVNNGLDPELDDSSSDKDNDDWTNLEEFREGTDPSDNLDYPADDYGQVVFRWINVNVYDTGLSRVSLLISTIAIVAAALVFLIILFVIYLIVRKIFR